MVEDHESGACNLAWRPPGDTVSSACNEALTLSSSHTRYNHITAHETTTQDTRSTRPNTPRRHNTTQHNITRSQHLHRVLSQPLFSMFSRISTLHISTVKAGYVWLRARFMRGVLFLRVSISGWSWVQTLSRIAQDVPFAHSDWSLHVTAAFPQRCGTHLGCLFDCFFFWDWFTAGSPYRESLHREIDGTVRAPIINNNLVIVMLYPQYTPLRLLTTSLRAIQDLINVTPRPQFFWLCFSLCPSVSRPLLLIDGRRFG